MKKYIGMDIGGTSIKYGIFDEKGQILYCNVEKANIDDYKVPLLDQVKKVAKLIDVYAKENHHYIEGVGVSATGQVDKATGTIIGTCGNIPGWIGANLKKTLEAIFDKSVTVENDANCAAIAEHWIGRGRGYDNLIVYTIGTGIGAGIILNGQIYSGHLGIAGEIGHMIIDMHGRSCTCGNRGCFEQYGSTTALLKQANHMQMISKEVGSGLEFFERVNYHEEPLEKLLKQFVDFHATGITNLVHVLNPEAILIGGGVSSQDRALIEPIRKQTMQKLMPAFAKKLVIQSVQLDNNAGMIGAVKNHINIS